MPRSTRIFKKRKGTYFGGRKKREVNQPESTENGLASTSLVSQTLVLHSPQIDESNKVLHLYPKTMTTTLKKLSDIIDDASCILLDVEGTTTSIDFVRNVLFPYSENHISSFIKNHWNDDIVQEVVTELLNQDNEDGISERKKCSQDVIIVKLQKQMQGNKKTRAIKELEGLVWKDGYIKGDLIGHVYPDVVNALSFWKTQEKDIFIYSTGSVEAQQLLYKYSSYGDLGKNIDGNFDTSIGSKLEPGSYSKICEKVQKSPSDIFFFSDSPQELSAAKQAGLNIVLVLRDPAHHTFLKELSYLAVDVNNVNSFSEVIKDDVKDDK